MNVLICGANSEIAQAFAAELLSKEQVGRLVLTTSDIHSVERLKQHYRARHQKEVEVYHIDVCNKASLNSLPRFEVDLFFCAVGYLGKDSEQGLFDHDNTRKVIEINFSGLVFFLQHIAQWMEERGRGTMMVLSSVAGERGRQSNFIYGSAKAGLTAYLSGLRNYMYTRGVHVITVKPGFMRTKMTAHLNLPPILTANPQEVSKSLYRAYKKRKNVVYVKWVWRYIMWIIRNIPESIFKKMKL